MRRRYAMVLCGLGCLASGEALGQDEGDRPRPTAAASPDGLVRAEVTLDPPGGDSSTPHLKVEFRGRPVLIGSPLRVDLADGTTLGDDSEIEAVEAAEVRDRYRQPTGKRSEVSYQANEITVKLRERGEAPRRWQVVVRASDDGVAFRYVFPEQEGWDSLVLAGERSSLTFPEGAQAVALPLNGFHSAYEDRYLQGPVADLPADGLIGLPLLVELPGTGWAAITEADLTDYAGMYLVRDGSREGEIALVSRLSPRLDEPAVAVRAALPHRSPWRVVLIGDEPGRLVESDLVLSLNPPCALDDVSWIRPGKTTFPWWNGFHEEDVPFPMGLNTETAKYYIDFCAEAGIPYHSLDGINETAWYSGPIVPYEGADPTTAIEGLDMAEVLRYAKAKGVRIRLWMHWEAARDHMERSFPIYREWGIEGVMLDFMNRDDQEMIDYLGRMMELAAANQLTVTLHGASKPTGMERTYPNLLSSEGVMNLEYDKWNPIGIPPEHEVTVPFTRMLAGPLDFHQGSFRTVPVEDFAPRSVAPLIMGTPCRTLASYVVFQNHLPMVADYPSAYRGHPALPALAAIPSTWDDTKVLSGEVGEWVVIARRSGEDWWVGAMTDREAREVQVPLDFLGEGRYQAEIHRDAPDAPHGLEQETQEVGAEDVLRAELAPAGGLLIRLGPVADRQAEDTR